MPSQPAPAQPTQHPPSHDPSVLAVLCLGFVIVVLFIVMLSRNAYIELDCMPSGVVESVKFRKVSRRDFHA